MAVAVNSIPLDPDTADLDGLTVIEASAGTGKTQAIQRLVTRLVLEGVTMPRMLVMSFTKPAAAELSRRIRGELQQALAQCPVSQPSRRLRLQQAMADFDRACIGTIHAFCQRMLQEHPTEAGVHGTQGWTLRNDETESRRRACGDAWASLVAADDAIARLMPGFRQVMDGLAEALGRREERRRVESADFAASRRAAREALEAISDAASVATLAAVQSGFNAAAREPAEFLMEAVRAGGEPAAGVARACGDLLDDETVVDAVPAAASRRAAAEAVLAGEGWRSLRRKLQALGDASIGTAQAALDTVVRDAMGRLLAHRAASRTLVFDDLVERLHDAVQDPSGGMIRALRARFDTVIVDEVQDTDPLQAAILERAFGDSPSHRLILVGDPKQSIYAFRNADVDSYMAMRRGCRKAKYRLDVSWRSDPALVRSVQHLYAVPRPFLRDDMPAMDVRSAHAAARMRGPAGDAPGLAFHVWESDDVTDMLDMTARAVAADLRSGWRIDEPGTDGVARVRPIRPADVAVLCHRHDQGRRVADGLRRLGVPVILMDQEQVWASEAAQAVLQLLAAMARPWDRAAALGALAGVCTGLSAISAIDRPDDWVQALRSAADRASTMGVGAAMRRLVMRDVPEQGRAGMLTIARGERLATDFDHVLEELDRAQMTGAGTVHALAAWLAQRVHGGTSGEESLCRSLGGVDAVQVMTLHGSKGLTFGVTWLPTFMVPSRRDSDPAEARRLLYVGLTRARHVTRLVWMPEPEAAGSPLAHLLHARAADSLERATEAAATRLRGADAALDLQAVADSVEGTVAVLPLDPGEVPAMEPPPDPELAAPRPMPSVAERAVTLSFTSLSSVRKGMESDREERDVDAVVSVPAREGDESSICPMDRALRDAGPTAAALGILVHDALADAEAFGCLRPGADPAPLRSALARAAVGLRVRSDAAIAGLASALQRALAAPSGDPAIPSVAELAADPDRCLRELEVAVPWSAAPAELAGILRAEGAPWSEPVARMLALGATQERMGSLVGSIDLAVERDGRWFIYDYKTNFLGEEASAYAPEALHAAMASALYPLQAAIYCVLLGRWLATRGLRGDAPPVIGGVAYLFLRGMDPEAGSRGTWTWRPSASLLGSLDAMLPRAAREASP